MLRRTFLTKAALAATATSTALLAGCAKKEKAAGEAGAPAVVTDSKTKIKWRLQTYAGAALAEHVIKPSIEAFNKAANGEMEIELYFADQLVPTGELFRAMQAGTIDAVQSDDDSMSAPIDIRVFGGYFPFATRFSLDVPALFHKYGLNEIWAEAYDEVENVTWLSSGSWDPCHFNTVKPITKVADLKGLRIFTFPTAGKFLTRFGVVPVTLPWGDVQVAIQTGELDGLAWSGITEDYTVGWADVTPYFLTNNISGAWIGSYFANTKSWEKVPAAPADALQALHRQLPLLPPALVLGRRGGPARERTEDEADDDSRRRVEDRGGRGPQVLGRDRRDQPALRQGGADLQGLQRPDGEGRPAVSVGLSGACTGQPTAGPFPGREARTGEGPGCVGCAPR